MKTNLNKIRDAVRENHSKVAENDTKYSGCGCGPEVDVECCPQDKSNT